MGWANIAAFPLVIISSGQPNTGLFLYAVPPPLGLGNPPVFAVVAPGVTTDPYGNPTSAVLNIGNLSAAHSGFDQNGIEYLSDSTGVVRIVADPARGMFFYTGAAALGNPPQLALALSGVTQDTFGNAIGTSKILVQANTITTTNGLIRTAAAVPLIQLDGGHNAFYEYNSSSQLTESIAPAPTNDGLGSFISAGFTCYLGSARTTNINLSAAAITFNDTVGAPTAGGREAIGNAPGGATSDSLVLQSPLIAGTDFQSVLYLQRGATPGPAHALLANADLNIITDTNPAVPANGFSLHSVNTGQAHVIHSHDGTDYIFGHGTQFLTTDQLISSTTFSNICNAPYVLGKAGSFRIRAVLNVTQGSVSDVNKFRLGWTGTISQVRMSATFVGLGGVANSVFAVSTTTNNGALNPPAFAALASYRAEFDGIIVTSSSGNIGLQAAETTSGDTFSVLALSFFHIEPV